jgi:hypothetical protein
MGLPPFCTPRPPLFLSAPGSLVLALGLIFMLTARAQTVNLAVDPTHAVRTVDERVFGLNAVLWDPPTGDAQTVALCTSAGIRAMRIPGGGMADDYGILSTPFSLTGESTNYDAYSHGFSVPPYSATVLCFPSAPPEWCLPSPAKLESPAALTE